MAIEVLSPGDSVRQSLLKVGEWLSAGTRAVILVDPSNKTVSIYRSPEDFIVLAEPDLLEIPDIIPGWSVPVAEIFTSG